MRSVGQLAAENFEKFPPRNRVVGTVGAEVGVVVCCC